MPHELYKTEGFVLSSKDVGEAEKMVSVFTKEFGLLRLFARGVRKPRSKLNPFLNLFTHGRFGFVSGKGTWHLIDAEDVLHFDGIMESGAKLGLLGRAAGFVERFHKGEVQDLVFWHIILSFLKFLDGASANILSDGELLFYAKSLFVLGYLDEEQLSSHAVLEDTEFRADFFPLSPALRLELEKNVSHAMSIAAL